MSSNHKLKISSYGTEQFIGKCACRLPSGPMDYRKDVEDWHFHHLKVVERARAGLATKTPTLKSQYAYFLKMSHEGPTSSRELFKQLAEELEPRLADNPAEGTDPLFTL